MHSEKVLEASVRHTRLLVRFDLPQGKLQPPRQLDKQLYSGLMTLAVAIGHANFHAISPCSFEGVNSFPVVPDFRS